MVDDLIGKTIGGYEILNQIGQGGMATVYRAQQMSMNRVVAIKVLPRQFLNDDTYIQRFNQEVKIVSKLEHRNIVPVYDYGQYNGQPYIVMRYMNAGSVDDLLNRGPLETESILRIVEQIAPALDYAHSKGVLHRDLKPSNVLLDDDGGAFITDFGIARILGEQGPGITTQGVVGTPSYMSPEQAQAHALDGRSDVYSLGVMLFEMSTGRRPFEGETPYGIAVMQVTAPPPSPRTINPSVSVAFEGVVFRALKKHPDERYATGAELVEAIREAVEAPEKMHDTQPRPLFNTPPPVAQQLSPAPPAAVPPGYAPATYTPPSNRPVTASQVSPGWRARVQKRRKNNVWFSVALGGLIGCALLTLFVAIAAIIISSVTSTPVSIQPTTVGTQVSIGIIDEGPITRSPLDPTSDTARQTLIASDSASTEPSPSDIAPVGVRPTATFSPLLSNARGTILYFAPLDGSFEVFSLDLASRVRTQLTSDSSANSYPIFSPDGEHIAFQSNRDGDFEIFVMNAVGGEVRQLTFNETIDRVPSWSPDGQWIIYSSDTRGDGTYDLYRVNVDTGEILEVFGNGQRNSHARISQDGRYMLFTSGAPRLANTWEVLRLDLQTGEVRQLTDNNVRDASAQFSPDGQSILYITGGDGFAAIARMNLDGSGQQVIYDSPGYEWEATYSPDGSFIVFNNDITERDELYLMRADGSEVQSITSEGGSYPSWVP